MIMFFDLTESGFLEISGKDAGTFLQGQLTCDVLDPSSSFNHPGAHCNPQGRIISLFHLIRREDAYYLCMPASMVPVTLQALKKYAVFFKAVLKDASSDMRAIGISGISPPDLNSPNLMLASLPRQSSRQIIAGPRDCVATFLNHQSASALHSQKEWDRLNILDEIPSIYPQTAGKFLPHEIDLVALDAVSLTKGCYTGQEVIARMHYRGKLKTHLYKASIDNTIMPEPGSDVYQSHNGESRVCGMIVNACEGGEGHPALALMIASNINLTGETYCMINNANSALTLLPGSSPNLAVPNLKREQ